MWHTTPLKLSVTEDGLTAETGLTIVLSGIGAFPMSHNDELPLYLR